MAQVIPFPSRAPAHDEAMRMVAHRVMQHLIVVMFERDILDIPVQAFVKEMCDILTADGFDLDMETAEIMVANTDVMKRLERIFLRTLVERGFIPQDKA